MAISKKVVKLNDGDPLTIEWLNSIVDTINTIIGDSQTGTKTIPYFVGSLESAAIQSALLVEAGEIKWTSKTTDNDFDRSIDFKTSFTKAPTVFISAVYGSSTPVITTHVTGITKSGMKVAAHSDIKITPKNLTIKYLAIGTDK